MSNRSKSKNKKKESNSGLLFIKETDEFNKKISEKDIEIYRNVDYPLFSFKYFNGSNLKDSKDSTFFIQYFERLKSLSVLGWEKIRTSGKHQYGMEPIHKKEIKKTLPDFITPDVQNVHVFRATGDNHAMIGFNENKIFHVFYIEKDFNTIYKH